jgi:3-phenylpropionate/cinnamic acid dioxygenase small subunit
MTTSMTRDTASAGVDPAVERVLVALVEHEAELLDAGRWTDWLALWDDPARYWVPLAGAAQPDDAPGQALADDDRLLLQLRVERLAHPRAHSLKPRVACQHVLQRPRIVAVAAITADVATLSTPFLYVEVQGAHEVTLAGRARHRLVRGAAGWKIREKRVDLLNASRPLPAIQLLP